MYVYIYLYIYIYRNTQAFNSNLKIYHSHNGLGYILRPQLRDLFFHHTEIFCEHIQLQPNVAVTYTKGYPPDKTHNMRIVAKSIILTPSSYIN